MKFFTNKISNPVDGGLSWTDWLAREVMAARQNETQKVAGDTVEKTAREAKPECDGDSRGACRGQTINTDNEDGSGYQKGESVHGKKDQGGNARKDNGGSTDTQDNKQKDKEASVNLKIDKTAKCGKEMGESNDAGKVTEKHTPAGPGNDNNPEPKTLINNDPNYQKGESVNPAKTTGKSKKGPQDAVKSKKKKTSQFTSFSKMDKAAKLIAFLRLASNKSNPIEYVEAITGIKCQNFKEEVTKEANLKPEDKKLVSDLFDVLYPHEYVELMVKDK